MSQTSTPPDTLIHDLAQGMLSEMGYTSRAIQETHEAVAENLAHCYLELFNAVAADPASRHIVERFGPTAHWMQDLAEPGVS